MEQISVYLATAIATLACYILGLLLRPNKTLIGKIVGFWGLCIIGPLCYCLVFAGFLAIFFNDVSFVAVPSIYAFLIFGAMASPVTLAIGVYRKPKLLKRHEI